MPKASTARLALLPTMIERRQVFFRRSGKPPSSTPHRIQASHARALAYFKRQRASCGFAEAMPNQTRWAIIRTLFEVPGLCCQAGVVRASTLSLSTPDMATSGLLPPSIHQPLSCPISVVPGQPRMPHQPGFWESGFIGVQLSIKHPRSPPAAWRSKTNSLASATLHTSLGLLSVAAVAFGPDLPHAAQGSVDGSNTTFKGITIRGQPCVWCGGVPQAQPAQPRLQAALLCESVR